MNDAILRWNAVALEALRNDFYDANQEQPGPTLSSRALALVHLAMHDAYFAVTGGRKTWSGVNNPGFKPQGALEALRGAAYPPPSAPYKRPNGPFHCVARL